MLGELSPAVRDLWIVCHGFAQLAREFIAEFNGIATSGRVIVAPEALSRFYKGPGAVHGPDTPVGATWMTREDRDHEIEDYIGYLDTLAAHLRSTVAPDARLTVLGYSQGAATVSRWVTMGTVAVDRVILWGGLLPPEFKTDNSVARLASQRLLLVVGDSDKFFSEAMVLSERQRLLDMGIQAQIIRFRGGHALDPDTLRSLD